MRTLTKQRATVKSLPSKKGFILYEGPSVLDGSPIACIATLSTSNRKTGAMIQTWIIRADKDPVTASKLGDDVSICGNCPLRHHTGGACYVNIGQAPRAIFDGFIRGIYETFDINKHRSYFMGRKVRLGAYGDPAAVPFDILKTIVDLAAGHTGYTHQIKHKNFDKRMITLCMVSADSPKQALKYQSMGAHTFRVALADDVLFDNEIECLADSKGLSCLECGLCDGQTKNIAIAVHGSRSSRFKSNLIAVGG